VALSAGILSLALGAAFVGLSAAVLAEALAAAAAALAPLGMTLVGYETTLPGGVTVPTVTCEEIVKQLANDNFVVTNTARILKPQSKCSGETQDASSMIRLLTGAYPLLSCDDLAEALASATFTASQTAAALYQSTNCQTLDVKPDAPEMAATLVYAYNNPPLTCLQLAQALAAAGYAPANVAPVLTAQAACAKELQSTAVLAEVLIEAYPKVSCQDLAGALAVAQCDITGVSRLLKSATATSGTLSATDMATILTSAFPPSLSCTDLEQSICGNDFETASATVAIMQTAYQGIGIGMAQMAQALAETGFSASVAAAQLRETYPAATRTAYTMAAVLLEAYDKLDCATLASASASAGYEAMDVAITLKHLPSAFAQVCTGVTDTASEMTALLLPLYPDLTCQQLAQVLAGAGFDPSSVAATLKAPSTNLRCSGQTQTAAAMSELLMPVYRDLLTEEQLDAALSSAGYPEPQIQVVNQLYAQGGAWSMYLCNAQHTTRSRAIGPSGLNIAWQKPYSGGYSVPAQSLESAQTVSSMPDLPICTR
jgi:hypothetical protein